MSERISNEALTLVDRVELATPWLQNALKLAQDSDVKEAIQVISFLKDGTQTLIGEPIAVNSQPGIGGKDSLDIVSFIPLIQSDCVISPYFNDIYQKNSAVYKENIRAIFVNSDELSTFWGSILTIHEGTHALAHAKGWWRDKPDDWSHWYEEYQTYVVELKLLLASGGHVYTSLVEKQSQNIHSLKKAGGFSMKDIFNTPEANKVMDCFPTNDSVKEKGGLQGAFNLQAYFYSLTGDYAAPKNITDHLKFIRWLHGNYDAPKNVAPILNEEID